MAKSHNLLELKYDYLVKQAFKEAHQEFVAFKKRMAAKEVEELKEINRKIKETQHALNDKRIALEILFRQYENFSKHVFNLVELYKKKEELEKAIHIKCHLTNEDKEKFKANDFFHFPEIMDDQDKIYFEGLLLSKQYSYFKHILKRRSLDPELEQEPELIAELLFIEGVHSTLEDVQMGIDSTIDATSPVFPPLRAGLSALDTYFVARSLWTSHQKPGPVAIKILTSLALIGLSIAGLAIVSLAAAFSAVAMAIGFCRAYYVYNDTKKLLKNEIAALDKVKQEYAMCESAGNLGPAKEAFFQYEIQRREARVKRFANEVAEQKKGLYLSAAYTIGAILLIPFPIVGGTILLGAVCYQLAPIVKSLATRLVGWFKNRNKPPEVKPPDPIELEYFPKHKYKHRLDHDEVSIFKGLHIMPQQLEVAKSSQPVCQQIGDPDRAPRASSPLPEVSDSATPVASKPSAGKIAKDLASEKGEFGMSESSVHLHRVQ